MSGPTVEINQMFKMRLLLGEWDYNPVYLMGGGVFA